MISLKCSLDGLRRVYRPRKCLFLVCIALSCVEAIPERERPKVLPETCRVVSRGSFFFVSRSMCVRACVLFDEAEMAARVCFFRD